MKGRPLTPVYSTRLTKSRETRAHIRSQWALQSNMTPKWMNTHMHTHTHKCTSSCSICTPQTVVLGYTRISRSHWSSGFWKLRRTILMRACCADTHVDSCKKITAILQLRQTCGSIKEHILPDTSENKEIRQRAGRADSLGNINKDHWTFWTPNE